MAEHYSKYFHPVQLKSLDRIGDFYIPGNGNMPSFSQTGCLEQVDVVLDELPSDDRQMLGVLLLVLRWMPGFAIAFLLRLMDRHDRYPEWIAGLLRLMSLALKGITMSLYYSGSRGTGAQGNDVHNIMGYSLHCEPDQVDPK